MKDLWCEHIEKGQREFRRSLGGVPIVIRPHEVANAWICELPNGKRIIGELYDVQRTVEVTVQIDAK